MIEAMQLSGFSQPESPSILRVRKTYTDGFGLKLNFPVLSISINGGPEYIAAKDHLVRIFDEVLSKSDEVRDV